MKSKNAIAALAALAQPTRLEVFRLLMRTAPDGCCAGEIAAAVGVQPATLSFHVRHLERAGLIRSRRASRHIIYQADVEGARRLVHFLTEDCCGGRPEICETLTLAAPGDAADAHPPGP